MPFNVQVDEDTAIIRLTALTRDGRVLDRMGVGLWAFKTHKAVRDRVQAWVFKYVRAGDEESPELKLLAPLTFSIEEWTLQRLSELNP